MTSGVQSVAIMPQTQAQPHARHNIAHNASTTTTSRQLSASAQPWIPPGGDTTAAAATTVSSSHAHNTSQQSAATPALPVTSPTSNNVSPRKASSCSTPPSHPPPPAPCSSPPRPRSSPDRDSDQHPDDCDDEEELSALVNSVLADAPSSPNARRTYEPLLDVTRRQVEFLFSNQSLWCDATMMKEMRANQTILEGKLMHGEEKSVDGVNAGEPASSSTAAPDAESGTGWVSLQSLLVHPRLNLLTGGDRSILIEVLKSSSTLTLHPSGVYLRRLHPLPSFDSSRDSNRCVFVDRLPPGSTEKSIKKLFGKLFGKVVYVMRAENVMGYSGRSVEEKGILAPPSSSSSAASTLASPKLKPRSQSICDGPRSPALVAVQQKLASVGMASPQLSGMAGVLLGGAGSSVLSLLSPAQRNRAIAAAAAASGTDPDALGAAFICFERPAYAKKCVSHIVAFNKQLKANTPKGSPRLPPARRGSFGLSGVPALPTTAMGTAVGATHLATEQTQPHTRSIRISSHATTSEHSTPHGSPRMTGLNSAQAGVTPSSPLRQTIRILETGPLSPGREGSQNVSAAHPPRHVSSPPPLHPLSPNSMRGTSGLTMSTSQTTSAAAAHVAATFQSPTFGGQPIFEPVPDFNLAGNTSDAMHAPAGTPPHVNTNASASVSAAATPGPLSPQLGPSGVLASPSITQPVHLPDSMIGVFIMPKGSYIKSLRAKQAEKAEKGESHKTEKEKLHNSNQHKDKEKGKEKEKEKEQDKVKEKTATTERSTRISSPTGTSTSTASPTPSTFTASVLSANAPVFTPSATPLFLPQPIPTHSSMPPPLIHPSTSPPLVGRAGKNNWRNDNGPAAHMLPPPHYAAGSGYGEELHNVMPTMMMMPIMYQHHHHQPTSASPSPPSGDEHLAGQDKKGKKKKDNKRRDSSATPQPSSSSPSPDGHMSGASAEPSSSRLDPDRPRFTLKRSSVSGGAGGVSGSGGGSERHVVSRFALGPDAPDAIGFAAGRGRGRMAALASHESASQSLPPAGGGRPLS